MNSAGENLATFSCSLLARVHHDTRNCQAWAASPGALISLANSQANFLDCMIQCITHGLILSSVSWQYVSCHVPGSCNDRMAIFFDILQCRSLILLKPLSAGIQIF